jgi:ubiquinone/menaquinone biosynthesis C-methylase UbiE
MTTVQAEKLTDEIVFAYWESKAAASGDDPTATIRDLHYRDLEIDAIRGCLGPEDRVLDIGCGNGYATLEYAAQVREIIGVDYSPTMVQAAQRRLEASAAALRDRASFAVADARQLPYADGSFSCVVMERCLINIPDRTQQIVAAAETARVLERHGLFLLAEVTLQGHDRVNRYRQMFGLGKLKVHWHNTYVDEPTLLRAISRDFVLEDTIRFGMYGFLSKVVHPLLAHPHEPCFDGKMNELAARIARKVPDFDGCTHQVIFVLRRK